MALTFFCEVSSLGTSFMGVFEVSCLPRVEVILIMLVTLAVFYLF